MPLDPEAGPRPATRPDQLSPARILFAVVAVSAPWAISYPSASMDWPEAERFLEEIGPGARRERLRLLGSPAEVRADAIRQFFAREGGGDIAELLMLLEEREWARQAMVEALRRLT